MPATNPVSPRKRAAKTQTPAESSRTKNKTVELQIHEIREKQLLEGNFDCFGRAHTGFCDQSDCMYYTRCIDISRAVLS